MHSGNLCEVYKAYKYVILIQLTKLNILSYKGIVQRYIMPKSISFVLENTLNCIDIN